MGWPFAGDWGGLSIQDLRSVFVSLANAVNERERARDFTGSPTYTEWWLDQDGTSKTTFPTVADFKGFQIVGESKPISDGLAHNLGAINQAVDSLAAWYVTEDDAIDFTSPTG